MLVFWKKNVSFDKIKKNLILYGIFFETTHVSLLIYLHDQNLKFQHNPKGSK